jgi:hypothetical protein
MSIKTLLIALMRWTLGALLAIGLVHAHAHADQGQRAEDELTAQQRRAALRAALQAQREDGGQRRAAGMTGRATELPGRQLNPQEREELRRQLRQQRRDRLPDAP